MHQNDRIQNPDAHKLYPKKTNQMPLILLLCSSSILALGSCLLADRRRLKLNRYLKIIMLVLFILNCIILLSYAFGYIAGDLDKS